MSEAPELAALRLALARDRSLVIEIKVVPRARVTELAGFLGNGKMKVKVAAVPEQGKANEALLAFLQQLFRVRPAQVILLSGATSQAKRVRISC